MATDDTAVQIAVLVQALTDHTEQDDINFARMSDQLSEIDRKQDQLLLREATRTGEAAGARKSAVIIATLVSTVIGGLAWAVPLIVNR